MDSSTNKRRKLGHGGTGPAFKHGSAPTSASGAFAEATQELLDEIRVDYDQFRDGVKQTLQQFVETIGNIQPHEPELIADVTSRFEKVENDGKIKVPYPSPRPTKDSQYKLAFSKPAGYNVVGSYQLETLVNSQSEYGVDMIVYMPLSLFQEKDFRDRRYFIKRAYYFAKIAAELKNKFSTFDFVFEHLHGNGLLPVLIGRPKTSKSETKNNYAIRIIPCTAEKDEHKKQIDPFPPSKLLPTVNNVKDSTVPTPFYNSTLRAENLFVPYLELLDATAKTCGTFKEACVLGRIWLQQRGLDSTVSGGGFGHFEWAVLIALLLKSGSEKGGPILSNSLNASQIFKAVIQYLAAKNFQKKDPVILPSKAKLDEVRQNGPVLYDLERQHNLLFKMTPWAASYLQQQAKWSHAILRNDKIDQFDSLFVVKVDQPLQIFDLVVRVQIPPETKPGANYRGRALDFGDRFYRVVKKALGDRSQLVQLTTLKHSSWPMASTPSNGSGTLTIGVVLNPLHSTRKMDLGPSVEEKEDAAKYREFWGKIAELRRFQDGSILESIEWDQISDMSIPEQLIRYIAKQHFALSAEDLEFDSGSKLFSIAHIDHSDPQYYAAARKAFETLEKEIREIGDLPLHIREIAPVSAELRYASRQPPTPETRLPMDLIISFEASSKWTDNIAANQRLKIAFLLKLGSSLSESNQEIKTHLGLEQVERDSQNFAFLDVLSDDRFAFRLRLQSDVEEKILESRLRNKQLERHIHAEAERSLATYKRTYITLPLHNQTLSTWCTRYSPLSDSIRILKHWFGSHKLASHFSEELLELFALKAFLNPYPWQTPTSAMTGFLRTLQLIARWDWSEEPLIVEHSDSPTDRSSILARYDEVRRSDPRMNRVVLFVATSHDASGTAYTNDGPSRVVANQMTKLARSACDLVKTKGMDLDPRSLFQSSLKHYDFVIRLNSKTIKSLLKDGIKQSHYKNLDGGNSTSALPLVQHPTVVFVDQLRVTYSNALVFFHGGEDDNTVGVLFNPELSKRTRKVDMPCAYKPGSEQGSLEVDRQAIVGEIARIGADLIEKIEVRGD